MRKEDQEKINKFSTLHQKELRVEEALRGKQVSLDEIPSPIFLIVRGLQLEMESGEQEMGMIWKLAGGGRGTVVQSR